MAITPRCGAIIKFLYNDYLGHQGRYFLFIGRVEDGTLLGESFDNALPVEIANFLSTHGLCARCGAGISVNLDPCQCGDRPEYGAHLKVVVVDRAATPSFGALLDREFQRVKSCRRHRRVRESDNTLTSEELALLLSLQGGLCFYCGEEFARNERGPVFHRDHYDALVTGGKTAICNTVLACPTCNAQKGVTDGATFSRMRARSRRPEICGRYTTMRRRFRAGLTKYLLERERANT